MNLLYHMQGNKIQANYMLVNHACKINFYKSTKVRVSDDFNVADGLDVDGYNFPSFFDLIQKNIDTRVAFGTPFSLILSKLCVFPFLLIFI